MSTLGARVVFCSGLLLPLPGIGDPITRLEPGSNLEFHLAPDTILQLEMDLPNDTAVDLELVQESGFIDLDLQPALPTSSGTKMPLMRTEAGAQGHLSATMLSTTARSWIVSVQARKDRGAAQVSLQLSSAHTTTPRDILRNHAFVQYAEAEQSRRANFRETAIVRRSREIDDRTQSAYLDAERDYLSAADPCSVLRVRIGMARLAVAQGRHAAARAVAEAALATDCDNYQAERAQALKTLGMAAAYQGDYAASVIAAEQALDLYERTGDRRYQGIELGNLSDDYMQMGATEHALSAARGALAAAHATDDHQGVVFSQKSIAAIHLARGELADALREYRITLDLLKDTPYPMIEGETWNDLGVLYHRMADYAGALHSYGVALSVWQRMSNRRGQADTFINRAETLLELNDIPSAAVDIKMALGIAQSDGLKAEHTRALRAMGSVKMTVGDWVGARHADNASLALARESGDIDAESYARRAIGDLDYRARKIESAQVQDEAALTLTRRAADRAGEAVTLAHLARDLAARNELGAAKDAIETAVQIVETQRGQISDPSLRTNYFASNRLYPDLEIEILMRLDQRFPEQGYALAALAVAERARARSLQDTFAERAIALTQPVPSNLIAAESDAADELRMAASKLARAVDVNENERKYLEAAVDAANRHLDAARGQIRQANPRYADLIEPKRLDLPALQSELLKDNDAVLEYWLAPKHSFVWVIGRGHVRVVRLPKRNTLETLSVALSTLLMEPGNAAPGEGFGQLAAAQRRHAEATDAAARNLAKALSVSTTLGGLKAHRLAIVVDGALAQIPFGILPLPKQGLWQSRHEITYLPSIATLTWLRRPNTDSDRPVRAAVFAAPILPSTATPLPYARSEAASVARFFPRDRVLMATGADASREAAMAMDWSGISMVHFASHAVVNRQRPELSGILLSADAKENARDGMLRMNDIYDLHMPADLVVLSGCETAAGPALQSEGVISLSRAFFYAGARRVVASLWPVDDRATAYFMREFYHALLVEHMPASAAITSAQQRQAGDKRWSANYYWAGWVLQGDWDERNRR